jgi:hypothetical protein
VSRVLQALALALTVLSGTVAPMLAGGVYVRGHTSRDCSDGRPSMAMPRDRRAGSPGPKQKTVTGAADSNVISWRRQ